MTLLYRLLSELGKPGVQSPRVNAVLFASDLLSLGSRSPSLSKPAHFKPVTSNNVLVLSLTWDEI